jgi:hypothetical protein
MQIVLLVLALVSGALTVTFILGGLRKAVRRHEHLGARTLVLTTIFSALTGAFTLWQLVLVLQQLPITW